MINKGTIYNNNLHCLATNSTIYTAFLINFSFALNIWSMMNTFMQHNTEHTVGYIKYFLYMQHIDCCLKAVKLITAL